MTKTQRLCHDHKNGEALIDSKASTAEADDVRPQEAIM